MQVKFLGAAQTVTGSKHMLTTTKGKNILLDCGLFQGRGADNDTLNRVFAFKPENIDAVILSHAHMDHSGNLPNLVKQGFAGKIYCTPATYDLCEIMLTDSAHIQEGDVSYINKKRVKKGKAQLKPLYTLHDVEKCLRHFQTIPYEHWYTINDEVRFMFTDAGHILGSAAVNLILSDTGKEIKVCFTGDIGRSSDLLLKPPAPFPQADYILCESTYGNRLHEPIEEAEQRLLRIVRQTCVEKKGKLLIPAFSLGRTQEIVYTLDRLQTSKQLPPVKVYVDSPLATNATNIMRAHPEAFNEKVIEYLKSDPDPFGFNNLLYTRNVTESMDINSSTEPCVIIAASGMMEAGRIKHHLKHNVGDARNTLLIVGYCPPESLGAAFLAKEKFVRIFGQQFEVKIQIEVMNSYSAHGDYKEMTEYLSCQDKTKVKKVFLVHGELQVQKDFKEKLTAVGFADIAIPAPGNSFMLE
ncbi:MAG: MBL fold metallo-hydrolase [Bacteroidia bacterium]|nr:MBL fold metallo-hydrolase [Bacteroidia bacterium]